MARKRANHVSIHTALEAVDEFVVRLNPAINDAGADDDAPRATFDHKIEYVYISPNKSIPPTGVSRGHLDGTIDGWPMPGTYEIWVTDSNGEELHPEAFVAVQHDPASMVKSEDGPANHVMNLINASAEDARITIQRQRAAINAAEDRERKARIDFQNQIDVTTKLQREHANLILRAERAEADAELARQRQAEAEAGVRELEDRMATAQPYISEVVDQGLQKIGGLLGIPMPANEKNAAPEVDRKNDDPPPPGVENTKAAVDRFFQTTLGNDELLASMVQDGIITWADARVIWYSLTGKDLGDEPDWNAWNAANEAPEAQEGAA